MEKMDYGNFPEMENFLGSVRARVERIRVGVLEAISDLGPFDIPEGYEYRLEGALQILDDVLAEISEEEKIFSEAKGQYSQTPAGKAWSLAERRCRGGFRKPRKACASSPRKVHSHRLPRKHCNS